MSKFDDWLATLKLGTTEVKHIDDDADGSLDCVDVPEDWCQFLWPGVTVGQTLGYGNAKDHYKNASETYFDKLPANASAQPGDIPVWDATPYNTFGHIAVNITPSDGDLTVVEQNTYTQEPVTKATRSRNNLIGLLRPKGVDMGQDIWTALDQTNKRLDALQKSLDALYKIADQANKNVAQLYQLLNESNKRIDALEKKG